MVYIMIELLFLLYFIFIQILIDYQINKENLLTQHSII